MSRAIRITNMLVVVATLLVAPVSGLVKPEKLSALKTGCRPKAKGPSLLAKTRLDPHCHAGIMNTEMTTCCQSDCGECHDGSDICNAKATNGRGTTCCPSDMLAGDLASCENSKAPCAVPAYVRAAPDVNELTTAEGSRTAIDDCGEAVPDEGNRQKLATHFLHFPSQDVSRNSAVEASCGEYGTVAALTAACDHRDDCMGFTWGGSDCLIIAGTAIEELAAASHDVYLKVEGLGGRRFVFDPMPYTSECSKECGGGEQTRDIHCKACLSAEATEKGCEGPRMGLGMCSAAVAMNADAVPSTTKPCNSFPCGLPCEPMDTIQFHFPVGGSFYSEVSWDVVGATAAPAEGEAPTGSEGPCQGDTSGATCCAPAGTSLHALCHDSFGDGWNGFSLYARVNEEEGEGTPVCSDFWNGGGREDEDNLSSGSGSGS